MGQTEELRKEDIAHLLENPAPSKAKSEGDKPKQKDSKDHR